MKRNNCNKFIERIKWLESLVNRANRMFDIMSDMIDDLKKKIAELNQDRIVLLNENEKLYEENKKLKEELLKLKEENLYQKILLDECSSILSSIEKTHVPISSIKNKLDRIKQIVSRKINTQNNTDSDKENSCGSNEIIIEITVEKTNSESETVTKEGFSRWA